MTYFGRDFCIPCNPLEQSVSYFSTDPRAPFVGIRYGNFRALTHLQHSRGSPFPRFQRVQNLIQYIPLPSSCRGRGIPVP